MTEEDFLTVVELADKLKCSISTVQNNVRKKKWPHKKFGPRIIRFTPEHVEQIVDMAEVPVREEKEKPLTIKEMVSRLN
ncbi:helix-turn-helix transcriptional regulator [Glutamicibacter sp. MCAF14]|uniref:helix-turn-helix transcriptional regulator n=1 Tax=Glutamicibacter sp. MCAF14 TaxID=3233043 RepID=UPI003F9207F8